MARTTRSTGHRARRAIAALAVLAAGAGASATMAPSAAAAGILPTTTTVTASPASSTAGEAVTLTAAVKVLGLPGLGITPTGSVSFSASGGSGTTGLGSAKIGSCLLKTCTARLTTTALPVGSTTVRATYGGDLLAAASTGTAAVTVASAEPEPDVETEETCGSVSACETETITSPDETTALQVSSPDGNQTVTASLTQGGTLECPGQGDLSTGGALAIFDSTSPTAGKTITYTLYGDAAFNQAQNYSNHTTYLGCYGSPNAFFGYTDGAYGPATFDPEDGLYKAQLSNCANNGGAKPCFTHVDGTGLPQPYSQAIIQTPPGDPRFI